MKSKKLTVKQKLFADEYIKTGNATDAAIKAGYSMKTARSVAAQNLTKLNIKSYIDGKMKEIESRKIMGAKEALEKITKVARGEAVARGYMEIDHEMQLVDIPPSTKEILDASKEIMKRHPLTDITDAQIRKANAEARSAELDAEIKQAQLDSINQVADKAADKLENWSEEDLKRLIEVADEHIAEDTNN